MTDYNPNEEAIQSATNQWRWLTEYLDSINATPAMTDLLRQIYIASGYAHARATVKGWGG